MLWRALAAGIVWGFLAAPMQAQTAPKFADATAESALEFVNANSPTTQKYLIETMTGGVALLDYDGDGWLDVFFPNGAQIHDPQDDERPLKKGSPRFWNRLYRNVSGSEGSSRRFVDVTEEAGLRGSGYGMGAAVGDIDNDGDPDLLVTNFGGVLLYRNNGDGTFSDITREFGLSEAKGWFTSAGFFDYDNDGTLDLFLCRYLDWTFADNIYCGTKEENGRSYCHPDNFQPISNLLFRGTGKGTFENVSASSNIGAHAGKALGVAFADFDGDGLTDITVANDSHPQFLFRNNGDGTFDEIGVRAGAAYDEDGKTFAGMGTDAADLDADGWPDIVTTTLSNQRYAYFVNVGGKGFEYRTQGSGIGRITQRYAGWGVRAIDYDLDGVRDLFFANSHVMDNIHLTQPHVTYEQPPLLLRGATQGFTDVSRTSGAIFTRPLPARGAAIGDIDNDGDVDIVMGTCGGPAVYLRNDGGNRNAWLGLRLRGTGSNRDALGAQVDVVDTRGRMQRFVVSTAASYQSAQDPRLVVGFGDGGAVKEIRIRWPGGSAQKLGPLAIRQWHTIVEPAAPETGVAR